MSPSPPSRSSSPRIGRLMAVLLLPALGFAGLWAWSRSIDTTPPPDAVPAALAPTTSVDSGTPSVTTVPVGPGLGTALISLRRMPDAVIDDVVAERNAAVEAPLRDALSDLVGDDACVVVVDAEGETVFDHRAMAPLVPASNEKLFVAAVALDQLDNDMSFTTEVLAAAPTGGSVDGPLYLVGGGDPLLSTAEFAEKNGLDPYRVATLDGLVMQLVAGGVTRVTGDVVGVDARYDSERRAPEWSAAITSYDVPPLGSLVVDDGLDGAGSVPDDTALTAAKIFRRKLIDAGIAVEGGASSSTDGGRPGADQASVIASAKSPPVSAVVTEMLQLSDNLTAELLLKEIGLSATGVGSRSGGLKTIMDRLDEWGVAHDGVELTDGSGLSRANRVTCTAMVELLDVESVVAEVIDDLPVAGVSGTLSDALRGSPAVGSMRAKTGTLNGVKALSGVQTDASGDDVSFSVILNGPDRQLESNYEPVWRAVAELIARHNTPLSIDRGQFSPRPAGAAPTAPTSGAATGTPNTTTGTSGS